MPLTYPWMTPSVLESASWMAPPASAATDVVPPLCTSSTSSPYFLKRPAFWAYKNVTAGSAAVSPTRITGSLGCAVTESDESRRTNGTAARARIDLSDDLIRDTYLPRRVQPADKYRHSE